jgi:hypothetical protein
MFCCGVRAFLTLAVAALTIPAYAQSVISTRAGIVHFFEGTVYLGDQPLESHPGRFSSVPQGAELRTARGLAEVLLTPGVFVRIGEKSAIRMLSNELADTRVELLAGSAAVDSDEPSPSTSVRFIYKSWCVRFPKHGTYRIDTDPPRLWVIQGRAEVSTSSGAAVSVEQGMDLPFAPVLVPEQSIPQLRDELTAWAEGRQQSIAADNAIAANIQDPATMDISNPGLDGFTYFPVLGVPSLGLGFYSPYSSLDLYQAGFNSIYLPGYTYVPSFLLIGPGRFPPPLRPYPIGPVFSHPPVGPVSPHPIPVRPVSGPHPTPVHPVSGVGVHVGAHR